MAIRKRLGGVLRQLREEACTAAIGQARGLRAAGTLDQAIRVLERADVLYEGEAGIASLLDELLAEKEAIEARRRAEEEQALLRRALLVRRVGHYALPAFARCAQAPSPAVRERAWSYMLR